jgi:hypothetical protein
VQEHVHATDAEHGGIEVVAVERAGIELLAGGVGLVDRIAVMGDEMLRRGDEKPCRAAGGIADDVLGSGGGHLDH